MMMYSKWFSVILFIFYIILLIEVIQDHNMIAMYMMAIGMLAEAAVCMVQAFRKK
ncbi:hypothetical protein [Levilactobacillus bambusae]|uniref:hypothetical protein n=1 Tax=Levilactobacillus bambusae TaxID=2024736 RepID=UPI0014031A8C|nr:hypothetical protein [Levilactobacillus bambusae]